MLAAHARRHLAPHLRAMIAVVFLQVRKLVLQTGKTHSCLPSARQASSPLFPNKQAIDVIEKGALRSVVVCGQACSGSTAWTRRKGAPLHDLWLPTNGKPPATRGCLTPPCPQGYPVFRKDVMNGGHGVHCRGGWESTHQHVRKVSGARGSAALQLGQVAIAHALIL